MEDEIQEEKIEEKAVRLSLHLIVKRHLPPEADKWDQEKMVEALNKITHLRLDREKIGKIDNLELLGEKVTNLYMQCNRIERIKNLECLKNLSFITLANNRLKKIENLTTLNKLVFLDLSENLISKVDVDELPKSIIILNLKGNPCTDYPDYRSRLVHDIPKLKQLDLNEVTKSEKLKAGHSVSSDEEEEDDDDEDEGPPEDNGHGKDESVQTFATRLMVRSQKRLEDTLKVHKRHTAELDDLRISWNVPPSSRSTARTDRSRSLANSSVIAESTDG